MLTRLLVNRLLVNIVHVKMWVHLTFVLQKVNLEARKCFFFSNCDGAPLGVGALCKLHTLRIGSSSTGYNTGKIKSNPRTSVGL